MYRIVDSKFEGSNSIDFSHPQMLYHICDTPLVCYNELMVQNKQKCRYVRYKVREDAFLELAELHFYQGNEEVKAENIIACEPYYANADEFIRPGDTYELFYWGKDKKWISLGKQKATGVMLQYRNVPKDALLFLHDETRGREEEVFFIRNGKQFFLDSLPH